MKVTDLIEALQAASDLFQREHGKPMEIFDITFSEDGYDGDMHIQSVGEVNYEIGGFGYGQKRGMKPHEDIKVRFEIKDEKIVDCFVSFEDAP